MYLNLFKDLDYRFGWRWLLPIVAGDKVLLLGFGEQELAFWKQVLGNASVMEEPCTATVWLVNDLPPDCADDFDTTPLRSLCVVGSGKIVAEWRRWMDGSFVEVTDFAMLPSARPRLVVPLGKSDWIVQGLALHRPGRFFARVAVALFKVMARVGIDRPLRARLVCIANRDGGIPPQGAWQTGLELNSTGAPQSFALYLGTPDDNRKTVILPLSDTQQAIIKEGESPKAQAALRNEADTLRTLSLTPLAAEVPELFNVVESDGRLTLHLEYRLRQRMTNAGLKRAAVDFLVELSRQSRSARPLVDVLSQSRLMKGSDARATGQITYARVRDRMDALAAGGAVAWGHRSHGDFALWNCSWTDKGFFVFDWEESLPWDVAFGDAFYMAVASSLHITSNPDPARTLGVALEFAARVVARSGFEGIDINLYFALWALPKCDEHALFGDMLSILEVGENA